MNSEMKRYIRQGPESPEHRGFCPWEVGVGLLLSKGMQSLTWKQRHKIHSIISQYLLPNLGKFWSFFKYCFPSHLLFFLSGAPIISILDLLSHRSLRSTLLRLPPSTYFFSLNFFSLFFRSDNFCWFIFKFTNFCISNLLLSSSAELQCLFLFWDVQFFHSSWSSCFKILFC